MSATADSITTQEAVDLLVSPPGAGDITPMMVPKELSIKLPKAICDIIRAASQNPDFRPRLERTMSRASDFLAGRNAAMLAAVAADPLVRQLVDGALDRHFASAEIPETVPEVIIGSGVHGMIYASVRFAQTGVKPLIVEQASTAGGIFACSRRPAWYLNSRNRPGTLAVPGDFTGSLNYFPENMLQPSEIPGGEYQTNCDLGWLIRTQLAMAGITVCDAQVAAIERDGRTLAVYLRDGRTVMTSRVVIAAGLGEPIRFFRAPQLLTFAEFMCRADEPFPLGDLGRVAVIGSGDGGKTVIEALSGQSPMPAIMALDYPTKIDWYGGTSLPTTCEDWEAGNRSRYKKIGGLLRGRVNPIPQRAETVRQGYQAIYVNGARYDTVVDARGFTVSLPETPDAGDLAPFLDGGRAIAMREGAEEIYVVGPAAKLPLEDDESPFQAIPENTTAIFRYADRSASLAGQLVEVQAPASRKARTGSKEVIVEDAAPGVGDLVEGVSGNGVTLQGVVEDVTVVPFLDAAQRLVEAITLRDGSQVNRDTVRVLVRGVDRGFKISKGDRISALMSKSKDESNRTVGYATSNSGNSTGARSTEIIRIVTARGTESSVFVEGALLVTPAPVLETYRVRKGDRIRAFTNRTTREAVEGIAREDVQVGLKEQIITVLRDDDRFSSVFAEGAVLVASAEALAASEAAVPEEETTGGYKPLVGARVTVVLATGDEAFEGTIVDVTNKEFVAVEREDGTVRTIARASVRPSPFRPEAGDLVEGPRVSGNFARDEVARNIRLEGAIPLIGGNIIVRETARPAITPGDIVNSGDAGTRKVKDVTLDDGVWLAQLDRIGEDVTVRVEALERAVDLRVGDIIEGYLYDDGRNATNLITGTVLSVDEDGDPLVRFLNDGDEDELLVRRRTLTVLTRPVQF